MHTTRTLLASALASILFVFIFAPPASATTPGTGAQVSYETVPGHGGIDLKAMVITPTGYDGPRPLLVMPAAWSTSNLLYVGAAKRLAYESGYQVISYTSRGFWDSGGEVEVAGPQDVADARAVIDWGLRETDADSERIGMAGISYGAGISLLTAAEDDRVKAVGALSGWSDLAGSIYANETISFQAVELLLTSARLTGRPGDALQEMESEYRKGNVQPALELAPERSVSTKMDALNANGPAVMIGHAWNDGIFPAGQFTDFYGAYTGPKRLMLSAGDHATPEAFGAFGLPNETWESLTRWFDHHLRGADNGIDAEDPVRVKPNNGGEWASYPDWESVTEQRTTLHLGEPERSWSNWQYTGGLEEEPRTGWDYGVRAGVGTTAESGTLLLSGALQQFARIPTGVSLPLVDRRRAGVWTGEAHPDGVRISGTPQAEVTVTPTDSEQSLYVYLYDVDRHGTGSLVTHKPYTLRDAEPGQPVDLDVALEPVVWEVPSGHRLALVVDTRDARYTDESDIGERVAFGSPESDPAALTVPTA
ncbi:X-Pro dipeptidyl-peptidase [Streptomonospora alba]|uniref:X-Pro dipeptidyl-peptidase n=1 Tax=Streptomonospora alba TaxID=183763 RepID=A0A0C2JNA6_9ACTN|nr:CocE/NonD family hydrolase [Streptomonospora alba]KII00436.1 X-Pro dipeptidyl-peptidase [Streptomonospora alba]